MRSFGRLILALALCASAAGCLTTSPEEQARRNEARCASRGYTPGTPEFADCVLRVDNERDQRMERNRREMMERPPVTPGNRGY